MLLGTCLSTPCSSCPPSPARGSSLSFLLLRSREKGLDTGGKEVGSESWRTVNHVNSSVHKFCKALIIQDAGCHPNAINSMFLTLLLRKVFFMAGWFCCIVWRKSCLTGTSANTNLFILYLKGPISEMLNYFCQEFTLLKVNLWCLQTHEKFLL